MSKIYTRVSRVADWAGWCSPCGSEDRPLVLTRSGPGGVHSWLSGLSDEDRILLLTCRVCGEWQFVPAREEDDPEILLEADEDVTPEVREVVSAIVAEARSAAAAAPAPMAPAPRAVVPAYEDRVYDARATAEPTLLLPAPAPLTAPLGVPDDGVSPSSPPVEVPVLEGHVPTEPVAEPVAAVAAVEAVVEPVAELPAPRPTVERIVTVPDSDAVTLPAFSPEAVAAAAQVLSAARATLEVPAPRAADRARRSRGGPTPRRVQRPATARAHLAEVATVPALPEVLGLPAGTRQLVLAAAS